MSVTKITLEEDTGRSVTIVCPRGDLDMSEMVDDLLKPLLLAWGFHPDTVAEALGDEE